MIDPITPGINVKWDGRVYPLQLTLGALAGASRVLRMDLMGMDMMTVPDSAAGPLYLFAVLHRKFPHITIEQCEDAYYESPEATDHYRKVVEQAKKSIEALVVPYEEARKAREAKEAGRPLEETPSGDDCGPTRS